MRENRDMKKEIQELQVKIERTEASSYSQTTNYIE
jgi:hypothetical protein